MEKVKRTETEATPVKADVPQSSSPGIIILQWLTYAFWGWTLLSFIWLAYIVIATFVLNRDLTDIIPYAIAATLVLLPLSLVCDIFYSRKEPVKKAGAAMVVMVIHAVIFALFGIGLLITAVLSLVQVLIGGDEIDSLVVWILTSLASAIVYAVAFVRTLNPVPRLRLNRILPLVMAGVVGLFIVLGFVGPVAQAAVTRDDRDIERSLPNVYRSINRYIADNEQFPQSLDDINLSSDAQSLVDRNLVTYKTIGVTERASSSRSTIKPLDIAEDTTTSSSSKSKEYRYQLCVTFKQADSNDRSYYDDDDQTDGYRTSVSVYGHPAGNVCYKLKQTVYND